jgi:hypothetical protein
MHLELVMRTRERENGKERVLQNDRERTGYKNEWERRTRDIFAEEWKSFFHVIVKTNGGKCFVSVCVTRFFSHRQGVSNFSQFLPVLGHTIFLSVSYRIDNKNDYFFIDCLR